MQPAAPNPVGRAVTPPVTRWSGCVTLALGATLAACGPPPGPHAAPAVIEDVAFVSVTVLPMAGEVTAVPDQTVLVSGGSIVAVGGRDNIHVPDTTMVVNGAGQYLMPGLADMHVHLEYADDSQVLDLALANGITTVRNMDGRPYILAWRDAVARGELRGPTIHTAGPILDGDPPLRDDNLAVASVAEATAAVQAQAAAGYDFVKVYTNLSDETYEAVLEAAAANGLSVSGHVPRGMRVEEVLDSGIRSIEHVTELGDLVEADDSPFRDGWHWSKLYLGMPVDPAKIAGAAARVADAGVWIVPTMVQADRGLAPSALIDSWLQAPEMAFVSPDGRDFWESLATRPLDRMDQTDWARIDAGRTNRLRLVRALDEAGAGLLVGTDTPNPFVVPGFSFHEELANFEAAGIERARILAMATRGAAQFLGAEEDVGTVEVGKRADLLLLDTNPLDSLDALRRPAGVMARGAWYPAPALADMLAAIESRGGL